MTRREEIERVKELGEEIGYGNMMDIASGLWGILLKKQGMSAHFALCPATHYIIPKNGMKKHIEQQDKRIADIEACLGREELVTEDTKAYWNIWGGWSGNHDLRIEDATCSNCGYMHETVFGSTKKLAKNCPGCNRKMSVCER